MQLTEQHIIKKSHKFYNECDKLTFNSKNLYNYALYNIRQRYIDSETYYQFGDLNSDLKHCDDYKKLPSKVSNQVLKLLDKNWKSFFKSIKDYSKNPKKYKGRPKLPKYKHKTKGRNSVVYTNQAISKNVYKKEGLINPSKTNIKIKSKVNFDKIKQVRIIPKIGYHVIEIVYECKENDYGLNKNNIMGIDLGLNNLASIATTNGYVGLVNGKPLKSMNQFFNKEKAKLQSCLPKNKFTSNRIESLTHKHQNKVKNYLHKASKVIIDQCLIYDIGTVVIGLNKHWKTDCNMGKKNNQNFVQIPHSKLIELIQYKAKLYGIEVITREESYTSKCSFIDNEDIKKQNKYKGKRVYRGLFKSSIGITINADINGALNIIRKEFSQFKYEPTDRGLVANPSRINLSK